MSKEITFFFDENISLKLAESLRQCRAPGIIQHSRKIGMSGLGDAEWIAKIAEKGWIAISTDRNPKTRGITSRELAESGATYLMIGQFFDHMRSWDRAKWMIRHWDYIYESASSWPAGSVWLMQKNGKARREA